MSLAMSAKGERQTVVFAVDLHCQGCIDKVEHNIAFEKGVKDLQCNLSDKTVTVTFDPTKTSVEALQSAFDKIKKPATLLDPTTPLSSDSTTPLSSESTKSSESSKFSDSVDATSGASTKK